jgi:hypothetical protein
MPRGTQIDPALLQAALEGLEHRLAETNEKIADVKKLLRTGAPAPAPVKQPVKSRPKRTMSAAARKRIAEAQRKRWAEFRAKSVRKGRKAAAAESES